MIPPHDQQSLEALDELVHQARMILSLRGIPHDGGRKRAAEILLRVAGECESLMRYDPTPRRNDYLVNAVSFVVNTHVLR